MGKNAEVFDLPDLRDRLRVFRDRTEAGEVLARMLEVYRGGDAIVMAVPAGGVPVGVTVAERLSLALDVAVVSKITIPWNPEAGYGAVAFDGTTMLNRELLQRLGLREDDVHQGIAMTVRKVKRRTETLRGDRPLPDLRRHPPILVDDGLASGFTMQVAVRALRKAGAEHIVVAVPTAHLDSVAGLAQEVDAIYCPNLRGGWQFAVADAYRYWSDVSERRARELLDDFFERRRAAGRDGLEGVG